MSLADEQELDLQLGEAREQIKELRQNIADYKRRIAHLEASIEAIRASCISSLQPEEKIPKEKKFVWTR